MSEKGELQAAAQPNPGESVGAYTVESLLGEGGMGRVYKARGADGELVALKLVKAELAQDPVFRKRFDREAGAASRVTHSHVVAVLDTGEHRGIPYMAQRFISGGSLQDRIEQRGPLALAEAVQLCKEVGSGIDALHAVGLIHRDLKPGNILLDEEGHSHITDFGLAKDREASVLTRPGQALGSMDYMAPEQIRGEEITGLADVYALGCVMFECLSGAPPFADRQGMRILWAHLQDEPPDPLANRADIPQDVAWAVTRALEKEPEKRPPTGQAYASMIKIAAGAAGAPPDDKNWTTDDTV